MLEYTQKTRNIWFPDQVEPVYDPQDPIQLQIFREYWKKEKDRCINGFTLADGQVKVPGFLYWHTVYWKIAMYVEKLTGKKTRVIDTPYLRDIDWDITKDMEQCEIEGKFYTLVGSRDFGKALINSATLYTRTGELQIGDAQVGDEIYGADGKLTKITGVYPQGKVPLYQITLLDGRKFYCCDEHTWNVWDSCRKQYVNLQLKDIRKEYLISRKKSYKNRKGIEYRFAVPNNQPVEYGDDIMLPLDPYYLGAWLGDGTSRTAGFTTADSEILDFMTSYAEQCDLKVQKVSKYTYNITSGRIGGSPDKNSILNKLRDLNLLQNKHIPEAYFYTSIDNRMKLLQGLMDTDGSCAKNGTVEFSTTSAQIARGFYRLIRGLGILATVKKKSGSYTRENEIVNCKDVYRFTLLTDKPVFTLQRKLQYLKKHRSEKTSICNIEYFGEDFATCITVDNQDQLFLTDNYTVTHNSILAASRAGWQYTLFDNSEAVISAGAENYIKLATDKIEDGLTNIHPIFKKQRILNDWKKEVRAGWKDKKTNQPDPKSSNSRIIIRNYQDGNNTMAANGTRPGFHLIDEIGTLPNLIGCIKDSDGCWWSGDGDKPSCLPMFTGCVCAGTKVWLNNGKLTDIEKLSLSDSIIGHNGDSINNQRINWFKPTEIKKCYRITTDDNNFIECSEDHPILITRNKFIDYRVNLKRAIYQEAKDIKIKDQLLIPSEIPVFGNKQIEYARLLGILIGDGNYSQKSTPTISVAENEIWEYVKPIVTSVSKHYKIPNKDDFRQVSIPSAKEKLILHGLYGQTKDKKRLPDDIHTFDRKSLSELIAGYFDTDGNIYYNKKKNILRIVLTSISENLLKDMKYALIKFGIHCSIIKEKRNIKPAKGFEGQKDYIFRLYITQQQDIKKFKDNIPLLIQSKKNKLELIRDSKYKTEDVKFEINPLNNKEGYFNSNIIKSLRYTTVKKIEYIGEKEVYNLNCSPNHNYLSNNYFTRQTGGDMEVGAEAAEIFFTPDGYNILSFDNPEGGRMGRFISALRARMAFKEKSTLADYLGIDHEDLKRVPILVSNEQKAYNDWWLPQYEKAKKAGNPKTLLKFKAYWPLKASDSFLVLSSNNYNIEAAKNQKAKLIAGDFKGTPVWLYNDGDGIKHTFTDKQPITEFPVKTQDTDAPVVIWEFPVENPPWGLYIAGVDPYRQDDSAYSDSLGAIYIFKRMHDISSEKYQDMFVASYVARPKTVDEWNEQARLLIKYYNAFALVENDDMTFIRYMQNKGDDFYLCDQPEWLKDVVPNTTVNRSKGIHRSSEKVRNFLRTCLKRYLDDVIYKEVDEKTNAIIKEVLGVSRVFDTMLLEEIIKFNSKDGNYDREVAASLAIALADKMSPVGKVGNLMSDPRYQSLFKNKQEISQNNGVISNPRNMFPKRKNKLFY